MCAFDTNLHDHFSEKGQCNNNDGGEKAVQGSQALVEVRQLCQICTNNDGIGTGPKFLCLRNPELSKARLPPSDQRFPHDFQIRKKSLLDVKVRYVR